MTTTLSSVYVCQYLPVPTYALLYTQTMYFYPFKKTKTLLVHSVVQRVNWDATSILTKPPKNRRFSDMSTILQVSAGDNRTRKRPRAFLQSLHTFVNEQKHIPSKHKILPKIYFYCSFLQTVKHSAFFLDTRYAFLKHDRFRKVPDYTPVMNY